MTGRGFVVVDLELGVVPGAWVFVDERYVTAPDVVVVCWPPPRTVVVLPGTRVVHHRHDDGPHHDGPRSDGPDVDAIGRATGATPAAPAAPSARHRAGPFPFRPGRVAASPCPTA